MAKVSVKLKDQDLSLNNSKIKGKPKAAAVGAGGKVSNRLLETIEKRKSEKEAFQRPRGRRGRRPKNLSEYVSQNQDYDNYSLEGDLGNSGLEYDTGIKVNSSKDDQGFGFDRYDFDEELNFDR